MIDQQIVRLQITMNNAPAMQVFYSEDHLGYILLSPVFWEPAQDFDKGSTVTAIQILHDQIEIVFARERPIEFGNEVAFPLPHHDGTFSLDISYLIFGNHVGLFENFDREVFSRRLFLGQIDAAKGAFANRFDDLEIFDRRRRWAGLRLTG